MESALLDIRENEVEERAVRGTGVAGRRYRVPDPAEEFENELALAPVPLGRRTIWREIRVKVMPAVVFLLVVAAIIYFWPPF